MFSLIPARPAIARPRRLRHNLALVAVATAFVLGVSACNWPQFRMEPGLSGDNTTETQIGVLNVGSLVEKWTGTIGYYAGSSPAVVNGVAYIGSEDGNLYAFDAAGNTNCTGTAPKSCAPLWKGATGAGTSSGALDSSPAVINGVVYIGSTDDKLYAFDASGTTNCSGTPKTCAPLWTATTGGAVGSSPNVVNGVVYVGSADHLYAFDALGTTGCSGTPKTCAPLWTSVAMGNAGSGSSPAVANGVVYIGDNTSTQVGSSTVTTNHLSAFDAAGSTNCSGTPKVCSPLWTTVLDPRAATVGSDSSPAVVGGAVYSGTGAPEISQYDAAGSANCSGTPKVCAPTATYGYFGGDLSTTSPAVADGWAYIGGRSTFWAFKLDGTELPWHGQISSVVDSSPAVANGVVYVGAGDGHLYAFAAGSPNGYCGGSVACGPLWTSPETGWNIATSPAVANGMVYVASGETLHAYGLP